VRTVVLRWGHRPRDSRVTSHIFLTARAFGASSVIVSDVQDESLQNTAQKIGSSWGGQFRLEMGIPWRTAIKEWRLGGGILVHLTMYGENIETTAVLQRIRSRGKPIMILVGSQKVPADFYDSADFNVAVGSQPHSEVAALAVFLDRLYHGVELRKRFRNAKIRVKSSRTGKKVINC
jgi:tRNA (cytidine56-2'-O)-methyltransferase